MGRRGRPRAATWPARRRANPPVGAGNRPSLARHGSERKNLYRARIVWYNEVGLTDNADTKTGLAGGSIRGRNHEVTKIQPLLDDQGELREPGWSRSPVQRYDRSAVRAPRWRIKEWDYYLVLSDGFAGAFTISDDGYIGLQSVSLLCFGDKPWEHTETVLNPFPLGKLKLPEESSECVTEYRDSRLQMRFEALL